MTRSLLALVLLPLGWVVTPPPPAVAAPVPKPAEKKIEDVYGQVADAGVECVLAKGVLRVTVPKDRTLAQDHRAMPLVARTVEGDFRLTVRVSHPPAKGAEGGLAAGVALHAEGDPKQTLQLVQRHTKTGEQWASGLSMNTRTPRGGTGSGRQGRGLEEVVYLRLTRRGDEFTAETSGDGKKWAAFAKHTAAGMGAVVVGPTAYHTAAADHVADFEEYAIEPLAAEEKK